MLGAILDADAAEWNLEVLSTGCDDILIDFLAVGVALAEQGRLAERVRVLSEQVVEHFFGCGNADFTVRELLLRECKLLLEARNLLPSSIAHHHVVVIIIDFIVVRSRE